MEIKQFTFNSIPASLEEFKALPQAGLTDPFAVAALAILAFNMYSSDRDLAYAALDAIKGPNPLSPMDKQFIRDRFMDGKDYVAHSYFEGTSPENNYQPSLPLTVTVSEQKYSRDQEAQGYLKLFLKSSGADSERGMTLRNKPSTGQWFLWDHAGILSGIRMPAAQDDWA